MKQLGIIGTGHLSRYLCEGLKRADWPTAIMVSPHNPGKARSFAQDFAATIATSTQALVTASDAVIIAVRPDQCEQALRGVAWSDGSLLISVMAGVSMARLQSLAPGATVVRTMPVSSAEINQSPTPIFPANDEVEKLFAVLGTPLVIGSEAAFEAASVNGAVYGWYFALIDTLVAANISAGLSKSEALQIVTAGIAAAANVAARSEQNLDDFLSNLATPGGITAQGLDVLDAADALDPWRQAFEDIAARLEKETATTE